MFLFAFLAVTLAQEGSMLASHFLQAKSELAELMLSTLHDKKIDDLPFLGGNLKDTAVYV